MPPLVLPLPAALALLLLAAAPASAWTRALQDWDSCASFAGFAELNNTGLSCGVVELQPPAESGLQNVTLAWALAQFNGPTFLRLGLQLEDATWGAVAFPQYAYPNEAPPLAAATALVFSRSAPVVAAADGADPGGLTIAEFSVPGNAWTGLQPSTALPFTTVASGTAPGGGVYAVAEIPNYQMTVPSFGTHYPVRFMPALMALGGEAPSSSGGGGPGGDAAASGSQNGAGPWSSPPAAAGYLTIPYCCGDVQDVVWWDNPAPPSAATSHRLGLHGLAAAVPFAAAAVLTVL